MKVPSRAFKSEVIYSGKILIVEETHDKKKEEVNQKMCERERSSGFLSIICFFSNPSSEKRNAFSFSSRERKTAENNDHFKSRYVKKRRKNIQFVASYFLNNAFIEYYHY